MPRTLPVTERLPYALYRAEQVRALDRAAIDGLGIPGASLMERAGEAAFTVLRDTWPGARDVTVLCGIGNNGGDGYVVARLAQGAGLRNRVVQLGDPDRLRSDAKANREAYLEAGGEVLALGTLPPKTDLIVDALFGTGLEREVTGDWAEAIRAVNAHRAPVLAIDIPSGLHSDTGTVLGVAVEASATVSFIGLKQGMFTGQGPQCCGRVHFDGLEVPATVYGTQILSARRLDWSKQAQLLAARRRTAHKGDFGHVLVVGGASGLSGAARLAGEAAARAGAGLVSLATRPEHAALLSVARPELMCHGIEAASDLTPLLRRAGVVAIGPGLGRSAWALALLARVLEAALPLVVDADALNLLAADPVSRPDWVLTPHPGEAARLLGASVAEIQRDRFAAARELQRKYGGVVVLKGAGTLVQAAGARPPAVCTEGNPGMASGGMGDVLTGLISGLLAQGQTLADAAELGVCLHGAAGDRAAARGERGLLASDLLAEIRPLVNP
jgi:NAD(P)H-hydrate epimerase